MSKVLANKNILTAISKNLEPFTNEEKTSILKKRHNIIVNNKNSLSKYVKEALHNVNSNKSLHLGIIPNTTIQRIKKEISNIKKDKIDILFKDNINYALAINQEEIRHMKKPSLNEQDIINFISSIDELITHFDKVSYTIYNNQNALRFNKKMTDGTYIALEIISNKYHTIRTQTLFLDKIDFKKKKELISNV